MAIVYAALSALSGCNVQAADATHAFDITIQELHRQSIHHSRQSPNPPVPHNLQEMIRISVHFNDRRLFIEVELNAKVILIKTHLQESIGVPSNKIALFTDQLGFLSDDKHLGQDYNFQNNFEVTAIAMPGFASEVHYLDPQEFAPEYDYDFTNIKDNTTHARGHYEYRRPCGWVRFALKAKGKYSNNNWLEAGTNAWPVSYHGSQSKFAMSTVAGEGGICSCPFIDECLDYASKFSFKGEEYYALFQNRVNPDKLRINGRFYILSADDDIRPYGIIVRKVIPDPPPPSSGCIVC